jgi:hypothetical protein
VADIDTALMEQVLDVPKREREAHVEHHRKADDLRAGVEVREWRALDLPKMLLAHGMAS